jgi:uncharacterized protein YbjT (DUF2867 family)
MQRSHLAFSAEDNMTTVLVTGASGALGRELLPRLIKAGYDVRATSRRQPTQPTISWVKSDLETGTGLTEAVSGADVILHTASSGPKRAWQIDVEGTRRLLAEAKKAGVGHFLFVSIVGIEQIPLEYYQCKVATETAVRQSGIPWTILRATQFHNFLDMLIRPFARFPVMWLPTSFQFQTIDVGEVADELVSAVSRDPAQLLPNMGGPEVWRLDQMVQMWLKAQGLKRWVVPLPLPGKTAAGYRAGYNTCPEDRIGRITWAEWLQTKYREQYPVSSTYYQTN